MSLANTKSTKSNRKRVTFGVLAFFIFVLGCFAIPATICETFANRALEVRDPECTLRWTLFQKTWLGSTHRSVVLETLAYLQLGENTNARLSAKRLRNLSSDQTIPDALDQLVSIQMGDRKLLNEFLSKQADWLPLSAVFEASVRCHLFRVDQDSLAATFHHWAEFNPRDSAIEYYKGRWDEISDRFEAAVVHYQKCESQNASLAKSTFRKGIMLRELRRLDEALIAFKQIQKSDLESIAAVETANCYLLLGNPDAGWNEVRNYLDLPVATQSRKYLRADQFVEGDRFALVGASILESLERYDEALVLLRRVLATNHRDSQARALLISCLNQLGKPDEAIEESKILAEMASGKLESKNLAEQLGVDATDYAKRLRYAELLFRYKSLGESKFEAEKLLEDFPNNAKTHRLLARIYREQARDSIDWNFRADEQDRMALKLEAQNQVIKQSSP